MPHTLAITRVMEGTRIGGGRRGEVERWEREEEMGGGRRDGGEGEDEMEGGEKWEGRRELTHLCQERQASDGKT